MPYIGQLMILVTLFLVSCGQKDKPKQMQTEDVRTAEHILRSTFSEVTTLEVNCLPGVTLETDEPNVSEDLSNLSLFADALSNFMLLSEEELRVAEPYLYAEYEDFVADVDPDCIDVHISSSEAVWEEVSFTDVYAVEEGGVVFIQLVGECSWDVEHGVQLVFKNGNELTRVSAQDGHLSYWRAFGLEQSEDRIR